MKGAAQFWLDSLVRDQGNLTFLTSPSCTPDDGPFTEGSALDQQLIWQLFNNTLAATTILSESDKVFVNNLTTTLEGLSSGLKIGHWGQIQEWNLDLDIPREFHRYLGPLWAVYPGHQIFFVSTNSSNNNNNRTQEELLKAAQWTLENRGEGVTEDNLGWAKSWRAVMWARLGDGSKAYKALNLFKKNNLKYKNLLNFEEGFSGQLGFGAAIVEMVIQSRAPGYLDVLNNAETGLPERWLKAGSVQGFRTRDGHNVTAKWEETKVRSVEVAAPLKAGELRVRIGTLKGEEETPSEKVHVSIKGSTKKVEYTREADVVVLTVSKGQTYVIEIDP
ncbi:hypothetical protein BGZ65_011400 [Modicella reniformis]|uniref:Alpha-L-fucosidase n=1 Tax=Modicella reniformis TaxID=1440133 RepID=A0A9P6LRD0_9FUNG|nr:hypothetical protein BGZ65_011400 [Modicella reniformis]